MSALRLRARRRAVVLLLAAPVAGGVALLHGCIPDADTSQLPPFDAGTIVTIDGTVPPTTDAGTDSSRPPSDAGDAGTDAEAGPATGVIVTGIVVDYTQGNGRGVVPGATIASLDGAHTTTSDANGTFSLSLPAGHIQLNVFKPYAAGTQPIVYSTTQLVLDAVDGQQLAVAPVLHEGCAAVIGPFGSPGGDAGFPTYEASCTRAISGTNMQLQLSDTQSLVLPGGGVFSGNARIEMVPIAFPQDAQNAVDYSWGLGLPGASTPVALLAAVEIRVVADDGANAGEPLSLASGKTATITMPVAQATTPATTDVPVYYDAVSGTWKAETNGAIAKAGGTLNGIPTLTMTAPHLTWWAIERPAATDAGTGTSCFTGTVVGPSGPMAGVWVHGVGATWLGASTAISGANGAFCLDGVKAQSTMLVTAAAVAGGVPLAGGGVTASASTASGSCANPSSCGSLGTVTLAPIAASCTAGNLISGTGTDPATQPIEVRLTNLTVSASQASAGIQNEAYVGSLFPDDAGAFCLPAPPGSSARLIDPTDPECNGSQANVQIPQGSQAAVCGAGCVDAGSVQLNCP